MSDKITKEFLSKKISEGANMNDIAKETGIYYTTISNHKTGVRKIGETDRKKYAKYFGLE